MLSRQDPEHWRYRYAKKAEWDELYKRGFMTERVYLLSMELAGYAPREAREELQLLKLGRKFGDVFRAIQADKK